MVELAMWVLYAGMAVAMVGGATWPSPSFPVVGAGIALVTVGIVLKRRAGAPPLDDTPATSATAERKGTLRDGVRDAAEGIRELAGAASAMPLEAIKTRIEQLQHLGPDRVAESQEAIVARVGFAKYADVMAPLATAERLLYRAWSAATDGHRPECLRSLADAVPHAEEAMKIAETNLPG